MKHKLKQLLKKLTKIDFYPFLLLTITLVICYLNYQPGTFLTGWDNLQLELNYPLYLERIFNSVWQEYEGLGTLSGMAWASEIPRALLMAPLMLLETSYVRYAFVFITLILGPLGTYFLIKKEFFKNVDPNLKSVSAFGGSLFYLLNLGTLQNFYTPTEMFVWQYALTPWITLGLLRFLKMPTLRNTLIFGFLSFIYASVAVTPTIYLGFAVIFVLASIAYLFKKGKFKNVLKAVFILIITNLFWLLPVVYSLGQKSEVVLDSTYSQMVSEDVRMNNQAGSTLENFTILKGFWFDSVDLDVSGKTIPLMDIWIDYTESPGIIILGIAFFVVIILGLISLTIVPVHYRFVIFGLFLFSAFMLLGSNPPFGFLFEFLRNLSPTINEVLRFPFTKSIVIATLTYSLLLSTGIYTILRAFVYYNIFEYKKLYAFLCTFIICTSLIIYMFPAFQGNMIYRNMKVPIPDEYFEMFDWFQQQDHSKRVLHLPANTYLGWIHYNWGYRGSGFIWYGIPQPTIDRAFDVWSNENEALYLEVSNAIYSENSQEFKNILEKYNISYILLDENVIDSNGNNDSLFIEEIKSILKENEINRIENWNKLSVFELNDEIDNINLVQSPLKTNPLPKWSFNDVIYSNNSNYISTNDSEYIYPFYSLENRELNLNTKDNSTYLIAQNIEEGKYLLNYNIPSSNLLVNVRAQVKENSIQLQLKPIYEEIYLNDERVSNEADSQTFHVSKTNNSTYSLDNNILELDLNSDKIQNIGNIFLGNSDEHIITEYLYINTSDFTKTLASQNAIECSGSIRKDIYTGIQPTLNGYELLNRGGSTCVFTELSLPIKTSLIKLEYSYLIKNSSSPNVCIKDIESNQCLKPIKEVIGSTNTTQFLKVDYRKKYSLETHLYDTSLRDNEVSSIEYKNIKLNYLETTNFNSLEILENKFSKEIFINKNDELKIKINKNNPYYTKENIIINRSRGEASNCLENQLDSKVYSRRGRDSQGDYLELFAYKANNCDYLTYPYLDHALTYLIDFKGVNISGRLPRVYIQNDANNRINDIVDLQFSSQLTTTPIILNKSKEDQRGYSFNIENKASGLINTHNKIYGLEIMPINLEFIQNIYLSKNTNRTLNNLNKATFTKDSIFQYSVTVSEEQISNDLFLTLNQSYDKYWVLYKFTQEPGLLDKIIPFIRGKVISNHVKLNNWSNAWKVEESGYYVVTFTAQYYQNIGIIILILTCITLAYRLKKKAT